MGINKRGGEMKSCLLWLLFKSINDDSQLNNLYNIYILLLRQVYIFLISAILSQIRDWQIF